MPKRVVAIVAFGAAATTLAYVLFVALPRRYGRHAEPSVAAATPPPAPSPSGRKIKARFFYVAEDGLRLTSVEREVPYGEGTLEQARQILTVQLAPPSGIDIPLLSAIPNGTTLRALFVSETGEAFVDLSREAATGHPGGTVDELLTIYTIVNALTENLPAIKSVQLLVDGKEVETLAGHVDLRRPLVKNAAYLETSDEIR